MKPHEETWHFEPSVSNDCYVVDGDGSIVAEVEDVSYVSLISAAPDMARELLHLLRLMEPLEREGGFDIPGLATMNGARAALRKAGVLP